MGLRPRSIRARGTLLATLVAAVLLGVLGVTTALLFRLLVQSESFAYAETAAVRVAGEVRAGTLGQSIEPDEHVQLIQVIDANGRVIAATPGAKRLAPISSLRPPPSDRSVEFDWCYRHRSCYAVQAIRVTQAPDSPVVVAAAPLTRLLSSGLGDLINVLGMLASIGLVAALTWVVIGRALRPMEQMRAQFEEIRSSGDLSRRVPEPQGDDEISRLGRTANRALDQMDQALERQRQFASDASHELRTPIASLRANLEDALLHPDDTDFREVAEASLRAADRLEAIVTDLLLLARIGAGKESEEDIDLSALLRGETMGTDVRLDIETGLYVHGVRVHVSRIVSNLLDNAARYGGGEIRMTARREGGQAVITVTDEGPGIPPRERERIFGRFARIDTARSREAGGTGLGLAIAREAALAHGGSLGAEESPRGARFVLRLPLSAGPQEPTASR